MAVFLERYNVEIQGKQVEGLGTANGEKERTSKLDSVFSS